MKKLKLILGFALATLVAGQAAQAVFISGEVFFTGGATLDATPASATSISFANPIDLLEVISTGSYAGLTVPTTATFKDFTFGSVGTTGALSVDKLWTFTDGVTFSFEVTTLTGNSFSNGQRTLTGHGIARIGGFDDTDGTWFLSTSGTGTSIAFSSSADVPDSGATAALLGLGLLGLAGAARRFKK